MIRDRLSAEHGNASVSVILLLVATAIGAGLAGVAVNLSATATSTASYASMTAAIDQRFADYLTDLDDGDAAVELGEICYPDTGSCASISNVVADTAGITVSVDAEFGNRGIIAWTQERTAATGTGTHISGYDSRGNPVWVTGATDSVYTGHIH